MSPVNTPAPDRPAGPPVVYAVLREDGSLLAVTKWHIFSYEQPYELHPLGTAAALEQVEAAIYALKHLVVLHTVRDDAGANNAIVDANIALAALAQLRAGGKEKEKAE